MFHPRRTHTQRLLAIDFYKQACLILPHIDHTMVTTWDGFTPGQMDTLIERMPKDRLFGLFERREAMACIWGCKEMRQWLKLYSDLIQYDELDKKHRLVVLRDVVEHSFRRLKRYLRGIELTPWGSYVPPR